MEPQGVRAAGRVAGLDGLRGLAALYVLVHHCWLLTFRGYPANTGPDWLTWLVYGHLAVVVFITVSGFSLAISPARKGWRLGGTAEFARRRSWRILPPYWAALVLSLLIAWVITPQPHSVTPDLHSIVVYGLLLQDLTVAPTPNLAFWSIAVEAMLYLAFPLLLLIRRRMGAAAVALLVAVPVIAYGLGDPSVSDADRAIGLTPQFAPLFAAGMLAAGVVVARERVRRLPWHWLAAVAGAPVLVLLVVKGTVWSANHFYWIDLAVAPGIAMLLAALATRRPSLLVRFLDSRPMRRLGSFSYSLYLIHVPVVVAITRIRHLPHAAPGLPNFWLTTAMAVPTCLIGAWIFASIFEIPFQRHRGWAALRTAARARLGRPATTATPAPAVPAPVGPAGAPVWSPAGE
jgi:peptidoglycan/LPS O-acetylase OafA/YrhL